VNDGQLCSKQGGKLFFSRGINEQRIVCVRAARKFICNSGQVKSEEYGYFSNNIKPVGTWLVFSGILVHECQLIKNINLTYGKTI